LIAVFAVRLQNAIAVKLQNVNAVSMSVASRNVQKSAAALNSSFASVIFLRLAAIFATVASRRAILNHKAVYLAVIALRKKILQRQQ